MFARLASSPRPRGGLVAVALGGIGLIAAAPLAQGARDIPPVNTFVARGQVNATFRPRGGAPVCTIYRSDHLFTMLASVKAAHRVLGTVGVSVSRFAGSATYPVTSGYDSARAQVSLSVLSHSEWNSDNTPTSPNSLAQPYRAGTLTVSRGGLAGRFSASMALLRNYPNGTRPTERIAGAFACSKLQRVP